MFFKKNKKPSKLKMVIYIIASTVLGILLGVMVNVAVEIKYLNWAVSQKIFINFYNGSALPPTFQIAVLLAFAVLGFFLGRIWWRKIYVERVWRKK